MNNGIAYCCPENGCDRSAVRATEEGLTCSGGHFFPYAPGTHVPIFAQADEGRSEYSIHDAAAVHDNALRWVFTTFGEDERQLRQRLVARLHLEPNQRILITGAGAGDDIPYIVAAMGNRGEVFAQDIALQMLLSAVDRYRPESMPAGMNLHYSASDAMNLPFSDGYFDAAYHFGGINLFPNIRTGIAEMARVVRPGGRIVFGDEGVAPWLKNTEYGRMLVRNNALYACDVPLGDLPEVARDVELSWEVGNCFYVIEFQVASGAPAINIDVPHAGFRGGSIRTRYFGQLEGVDPALRDEVYAHARRLGMSRVEYLEAALRRSLPDDSGKRKE